MISSSSDSTLTCQHPHGCPRPAIALGWCDSHYRRVRKTGDPGTATIGWVRGTCIVDKCDAPCLAQKLCSKHYQKWKKYGDPLHSQPPYRPSFSDPSEHPRWKGNEASYGNVHDRLAAQRGSASQHTCTHCGNRAAHWAYDKTDPDQWLDDRGCAYSTDLDRYMPLCISCHWRFDGAGGRRKVAA